MGPRPSSPTVSRPCNPYTPSWTPLPPTPAWSGHPQLPPSLPPAPRWYPLKLPTCYSLSVTPSRSVWPSPWQFRAPPARSNSTTWCLRSGPPCSPRQAQLRPTPGLSAAPLGHSLRCLTQAPRPPSPPRLSRRAPSPAHPPPTLPPPPPPSPHWATAPLPR